MRVDITGLGVKVLALHFLRNLLGSLHNVTLYHDNFETAIRSNDYHLHTMSEISKLLNAHNLTGKKFQS